MPELPEVETLRRSLEPLLIGRTIESTRIARRDIIAGPGDPPGGFTRQRSSAAPRTMSRIDPAWLLKSCTIDELRRRGKALAILGTDPDSRTRSAIVVHLGMTGTLRYAPPKHKVAPNTHIHVVWRFLGGGRLVFQDPRRFGLLRLIPNTGADAKRLEQHWAETLGPDALTITADQLATLARSPRPLKAALLDQRSIAGVGNIYADEAAFAARLHPATPCERVPPEKWATLAACIRETLARAVNAGGSSIRDYADANGTAGSYQTRHAVYGKAGLPCPHCKSTLCSGLLASRTTVWCPQCQPTRTPPFPHTIPMRVECSAEV